MNSSKLNLFAQKICDCAPLHSAKHRNSAKWIPWVLAAESGVQQSRSSSLYQHQGPFHNRFGSILRTFRHMAKVIKWNLIPSFTFLIMLNYISSESMLMIWFITMRIVFKSFFILNFSNQCTIAAFVILWCSTHYFHPTVRKNLFLIGLNLTLFLLSFCQVLYDTLNTKWS